MNFFRSDDGLFSCIIFVLFVILLLHFANSYAILNARTSVLFKEQKFLKGRSLIMNLLEYFKQYPTFAQKAGEVAESEAFKAKLTQMDDLLAHYVPDGLDRRTEYRLSDEKEFIRLHCIQGISVEQTAERMCISRDTAYRIRRRLCAKEVTAMPCVS